MKVALLRLLGVTKIQDGGSSKKRIATTKTFYWSWATEALCYEKKPKKDNNLYDIEVIEVDKEKICMKIHFVGYGNEFDEWRDFDIDSDQLPFVRLEKIYVPDEESLEDRKQMFQGNLYEAIKRKLWPGRKEDP